MSHESINKEARIIGNSAAVAPIFEWEEKSKLSLLDTFETWQDSFCSYKSIGGPLHPSWAIVGYVRTLIDFAWTEEYVEGKRPNEIVKEYQKGYVLNGRLVRAAKVVVANDKQ